MNREPLAVALLSFCASVMLSTVTSARPPSPEIGDAASALPAIVRIPIAGRFERIGAGGAATAGYGFTGAVASTEDKSHRVFGSLAASYRANEWFAFAVRFDGRYDWHSGVPGGNGGGGIGDPNLVLRAGTQANDFTLGAEGLVRFPGDKAPSFKLNATSPELSLLAGYAPSALPVAFASRIGFRVDRSEETVRDPARVLPANRISLGVSDTNALLLGIGLVGSVSENVQLLGEWTWDLRVPSRGVAATDSPMRIDAGARMQATDTVGLQLVLEVSPSGHPSVGVGAPLAVIEPRVSVFAGVAIRPGTPPPPAAPEADKAQTAGSCVSALAIVRGRVTDDGGGPIVTAKVMVGPKGATLAPLQTDDQGFFEQKDVPVGRTEISVEAVGYRDYADIIDVAADGPRIDIQLRKLLPEGQIRGLSRSFSGEPIKATVRIEPLKKEVAIGRDGRFEVDVPPGEYDVIVKAAGYADQKRHVRVEANGVVVLDLDMRKSQ